MKVLIVDDEEPIRALIKFNLERAGYETAGVGTAQKALDAARAGGIDLVVLDLMLPDMSGLDVCRLLKSCEDTASLPIVMVTAKTEDDDIVRGLELGADDYITKPFSPRVLTARIQSVLRRKKQAAKADDSPLVKCGTIVIDTARHETQVAGKEVDLSATEFDILLFLARHAGQVFSRRQIIDAIKGDDYPATERSVDVQVLSIRRKIAAGASVDLNELIETIRGVGYRMRECNE